MKKKKLKALKEMSKDQLINDLMKKSIKGGCCSSGSLTRRIVMNEDGSSTITNDSGSTRYDSGIE